MATDWLHQTNYAFSTLAAQLLVAGASLVMATGEGARFPHAAAADHFQLVIWGAAYDSPVDDATREIVHAHYNASDTYDITRAQEGTSAKQWEIGSKCALVLSAQYLSDIKDQIDVAASSTVSGVVELATDAEAQAGTDTGRVVTPANLASVLNMRTRNKNVVINGAMNIWQRGTSFAACGNIYTADRFSHGTTGTTGVVTVSRDTDVPTSTQAGRLFNYSVKVDVTTADGTIGADDFDRLQHVMEGYDFERFVGQYGTLSFWVKSHKTGTYCVAMRNSGTDRAYISEYTISAADTWEFKTISVNFNYSGGTWDYTNGAGLYISWMLAVGSNNQTTKDAWQNGNYQGTSSQVNFLDSTDNNFWLTGVQLEQGSVATPFESRPFGEEVALCQRYFQKSYDIATAPGSITSAGQAIWYDPIASGMITVVFMTRMRAAPTVVPYNPITGAINEYRDHTSSADFTGTAYPGETGFYFSCLTHGAADELVGFNWTASAEL